LMGKRNSKDVIKIIKNTVFNSTSNKYYGFSVSE